mgnify:CR=1 FL=1
MPELKEQAGKLGIEVDGRWSDKRLQAEIDKASAPVTVTNLRGNPFGRLGLAGFETITLTAAQAKDAHLMARITHGVKTGVLATA